MQYRVHRYLTQFPITLITPAGPQQCHVVDVNTSGARIVGANHLERGNKVRFRILNDDVAGVVCWVTREQTGIAFRPQISTAQVDRVRYRKDMPQHARRGTVGFAFAQM